VWGENGAIDVIRKLALLGVLVLAATWAGLLWLGTGKGKAPSFGPQPVKTVSPPAQPSPVKRVVRTRRKRVLRTRRFTVVASGDLLIHGAVFQRALAYGGGGYDFRPMFRPITRYVRHADLALCHVETPLTPGPPHGYPVFSTPVSLARAIAATGWDACDTASNHSLDAGQEGIDSTAWALYRAGVRHTGSYRSAAASRKPLLVSTRGVKVALLAYTEMTNRRALPRRWSLNLARPRKILADARRARRRGARVVLLNLHWGPPEYTPGPVRRQQQLVRRLARSHDITAILGQGPHVVGPIRWVRGKPVVFSEGNLISHQPATCCSAAAEDGLIAVLHVAVRGRRARVDRADYVPIWVRYPDFSVLPVGRAMRRRLAPAATLQASYRRTVAVAGRSGRTQPVPRRLP
jgi:poly-gamma-glutamate capsule biosynthesis protein CapA/YwtB (metallophosphatase superfamily)